MLTLRVTREGAVKAAVVGSILMGLSTAASLAYAAKEGMTHSALALVWSIPILLVFIEVTANFIQGLEAESHE